MHEAVLKRPKPKFDLVEVTLVDGTGTLIVTFFKQPWLVKTLTPGMRVSVAGKVEFNYGFLRMTMPFLDKVDGDNVEEVTGQVIPVHAASEKVPQGQMRRIVRGALSQLGRVYDPLPASLRAKIIALDSALSGSPDAGYSLVTLDVTEDQAAAIVANPNVTLTAIPQTAEGASDAE